MIDSVFAIWENIIFFAMPLWLMGLGLLLCQRVGLLQWGIEGVSLASGALMYAMFVSADGLDMIWYGLWLASLLGMVLGMVYFILLRWMMVNQLTSGMAVFFLGVAIAYMMKSSGAIDRDYYLVLPVWFQYIAPYMLGSLLLLLGMFLQKTKWGMVLRGVGDEPIALNRLYVIRLWQFLVNGLGMMLVGLAGGLLQLVSQSSMLKPIFVKNNLFDEGSSTMGGLGFLCLLMVAVAAWSPYILLPLGILLAGIILYGGWLIAYGVLLLLLIFLLARRDFFNTHAPETWRNFFMPK
ncbi:MAG: ABC transporter permease subunit [Alphaproteobacteria bacterium]